MSDAHAIEASLERLRSHWARFWPGAELDPIAAGVRGRLAEAVAAWRLSGVSPFPDGYVALVCAARRDGSPVVLKLNPTGHPDAAQIATEGDALAFWQPTGAVPRVLDRRDGGFTLLMEQLRPGRPLDASGIGWDERLTVIGDLAARLHAAGPPGDRFIGLSEYASYWREAFEGEPALLAELEQLLVTSDGEVLIHADLHGGNALSHGEGWKVIDPHAVRGDRNADVWALIDPLAPPLPGDRRAAARAAGERLDHYTREASLNGERARAWTRLRARAEALAIDDEPDASADDRAWAERLHRMADALG